MPCVACEHAWDTLPGGQLFLLGADMEIIVESERDQRTLDWLVMQVGPARVAAACAALAGGRRTYVSNVAKALGLEPPEVILKTPAARARQKLSTLKQLLRQGAASSGRRDGES